MLKTTQLAKREVVNQLLTHSRLTNVEISKKVGVSLAMVCNIRKKISSGSSLRHKTGAGRPRTLRNSIRQSLAAYIRHKPHLSLRCLASNLDSNVSHETVRNELRDMTYSKPYPTLSPMLSEVHKINRVKWSKKYRYPVKEWSKTIFIDEMSIWLAKGRLRMWTKRGKKRICPTTKHSAKIDVWAAFSSMGVFPLCVFRENMNSQLFISIMEGHLLRQAEVFHGTDWKVVMDNDPKHTSLLSRQWIDENIPNKMPWPSQSPDMNPIENLFGWLKKKLVKKGPKTIKQLKDMLEEIWSNVDPEFLSSYWKSMQSRCKMVIEAGVESINY